MSEWNQIDMTVSQDWYMLHDWSCTSLWWLILLSQYIFLIVVSLKALIELQSENTCDIWLLFTLVLAGRVCFARYVVWSFCKSLCRAALWACLVFDVFWIFSSGPVQRGSKSGSSHTCPKQGDIHSIQLWIHLFWLEWLQDFSLGWLCF